MQRFGISIFFTSLCLLGGLGSAQAFAPRATPWAGTPERFLLTAPNQSAAPSAALSRYDLRIASQRSDGTPALAWGAPLRAPSNISEESASQLAIQIARDLAPELAIAPSDFAVTHVSPLEGFMTVMVGQSYQGVPVERAFVAFTFREGQLSVVRNETLAVSLDATPSLTEEEAVVIALREAKQFVPSSGAVSASLVVWAPGDDGSEAHLAYRVSTRTEKPKSHFKFAIDAHSGELLAVDDQLHYAEGEGRIRMLVDYNEPGDQAFYRASFVDIGGGATDADGETQQSGATQFTYEGPYVRVSNQGGGGTDDFTVNFSGPYSVYDLTPESIEQADSFVHLNIVKEVGRTLTPNLGYLGQRLTANVNLNQTCNAFYDGQTVNFFRSGGGCNNTGRVASIIYHEFGHAYHDNVTNNFVGSVSEGSGDYLASTILDDPVVGRGFRTDGSGIRRLDQSKVYPGDFQNEVHADGLIWATAIWELRAALMQKHGAWAGKQITDLLFMRALSQGPGLSTAYPLILAADDDDNDLSNGTPNSCEINAIFDAHGLIDGGQINNTRAGERAYARITHEALGQFVPDADGAVTITAAVDNASACGTVDTSKLVLRYAPGLAGGAAQSISMVEAGSALVATIDGLEPGQSFSYWFELAQDATIFTEGSEERPLVGVVTSEDDVIVFEDGFETGGAAWVHAAMGTDLVDDWEVGSPAGGRFDPDAPHSGSSAFGTDLGGTSDQENGDGVAEPGLATFVEVDGLTTDKLESVRLEMWHSFAMTGTLRVLADGQEVWSRNLSNQWSGGWRFLSIPLGPAVDKRTEAFSIRLEVEPAGTNTLGGWTIDDVRVVGIDAGVPVLVPPKERPLPKIPADPVADDVEAPLFDGIDAILTRTNRTRSELSGGCICVPVSDRRGPSFAVLALIGVLGLLVRRRRR